MQLNYKDNIIIVFTPAGISSFKNACYCSKTLIDTIKAFMRFSLNGFMDISINQGLFSIQTNNNNNFHAFVNMNTERSGNLESNLELIFNKLCVKNYSIENDSHFIYN